jgi:BclA C-terminal domain
VLKSRRTNVIGIRDAACDRASAALVACWRMSSPKRGFAMSKNAFLLTLLGAVIVCLLPGAPAQAVEIRTFVSEAGSDTNSCTSAASPCRHFSAAYAATPAGGEIDVLDPANYGSLTITGPLSIQGNGWAASTAASGMAVFTINAGTNDEINIRGVVLDGTATPGSVGIQFNSGGSLNIQNSVIRNFDSVGIAFVSNGSSALFVSNSLISDLTNANGTGINIAPTGGSVTAVINRADIQRVGGTGVNAAGSNTTVTLKGSTIVDNTVGVNIAAGATVVSYGNNAITSNQTNVVGGTIPELGARGPPGPAGATGMAGAMGAQGPAGPIGAAGAQGPTGPIGAMGAQGPTGPIGAMGAQGPAGPTGAMGAQGPAGPIGATGAQGATGPIGATGAQGATGPIGATGAQGATGPIGATGAQGAAGPIGATGAQGAAGPIGATGAQGPAGPIGATGAQGPAGAVGATGATGAAGAQGPAGTVLAFADFYALMPSDNPTLVTPGAAVSFPNTAAASGSAIVQSNTTTFTLATAGIYLFTFQASVTEAAQLALAQNGTTLAQSVVGRATGTSQLVGTSMVTASAGDTLQVINPSSNPITITPAAGGTNPVSAHLTILRLQ